MSDTSLVFNTLYRDRGVSSGLAKTSAAVRASQVVATVGTVALGGAMAGAAAHAIALGQSAIVATGAIALLPGALAGAIGTAIAAKVAFGGLGEAWKQTGAAAAAGGGSTVDIAHQVTLAHRSVRDATQALSDAQRDAMAAQEALTRAREDAAERLEDLSRSVRQSRLDERGAMLAVEEARRRLAQSRGSGDALDVKRSQLAYEESVLSLERARDSTKDLAKEQAEAAAKGVEGSDAVQSAAQRQEQSQQALTSATERLADAQRSLAQAGKSAGGASDKAALALAALAPSARELVVTMRELAPAWIAAGKAGQQATFTNVAGDFRKLSELYLPSTTVWLGRMGAAFNDAMRSTAQLALTNKFARDVDSTFHSMASTTAILAASIKPIVNGLMQFVTVGSGQLPSIADSVRTIANRFEAWAVAARESGRMQEWITSGVATLKEFGELAKNVVMSVVGIFKAGDNAGTLEGLVAASAAMRAWIESAEGQQKITDFLTFARNLLTDLVAIVPAFTSNSGTLTSTLSVFGVVVGFLADHLDTLAGWLPTIIAGMLIWKGAQVAATASLAITIPLRVAEFVASVRQTTAMWAHTAALRANTLANKTGAVSTVASTAATTAGDVATKRSLLGMAASKVAQIAGAAATGIATAATWLFAASTWAALGPILLIILAVAAFVVVVILIIKYHKEIGAWIAKTWDAALVKLQEFGGWLLNVLAPMILNALLWPYRMAWQGIQWVWGKIQEGAAFARDFVIDKLQALVGFVTSLPTKMKAAAANMWDGLKDSLRSALNWIIGKWNNFQLKIGGGTFLGKELPSFTLQTPDLQYLDKGGRVTESGLAVIHKGEDVVPAAEVKARTQGGGRRDVVELRSDGSAWSDLIIEMIRKAVGDRGGDVQFVLGKP